MQHGGQLTLDGFSFTATEGAFAVHYGLADWPDAMLIVEFSQDLPVEILLTD